MLETADFISTPLLLIWSGRASDKCRQKERHDKADQNLKLRMSVVALSYSHAERLIVRNFPAPLACY